MHRRTFAKTLAGMTAASLLPNVTRAAVPRARFSVMLWTLPRNLSFEQRLRIVANAGYRAVELLNEYETWTEAEWQRNLRLLRELNLQVDSVVPGRNALADPAQRKALHDDLLKALPGAKRLGCSQFIYTAYSRVPGQPPAGQRAAIAGSLRYAADLLEKDNIEIVLEPIDRLEHREEAVTSVAEAFEIVRAVGSPRVKVLYDLFHEQREAGNLVEKLEKNIDLVGLVHIADVPGRHAPGTGEVNFTNIYRKLAELHYDRTICMEFLPVGDPVQELRTAREEAERAMAR